MSLESKAMPRRNGALIRSAGGALRDLCCDTDVPCSNFEAFSSPFGCSACLCSNVNSYYLCVTNEVGSAAVLNTGTLAVKLSKISTYVFEYVEVDVRKFTLTFSFLASDFEKAVLQAYYWNGASWTLHRTVTASIMPGSRCFYTQNFNESFINKRYTWKTLQDWSPNTMSVTFSGVNYRDEPFNGCDDRNVWHDEGDFNDVTYSGALPNYPDSSGACSVTITDSSVISRGHPSGFGIFRVTVGVINYSGTDGKRKWVVSAESFNSTGGVSVPYFFAFFDLGADHCKGTFDMTNRYVTECTHVTPPGSGGNKPIGYLGSATLVVA